MCCAKHKAVLKSPKTSSTLVVDMGTKPGTGTLVQPHNMGGQVGVSKYLGDFKVRAWKLGLM